MSDNVDILPVSRAVSSPESIDFRFLNFSHPKDAKDAQTRRNVRSHVTSKQHERQRKAAAAVGHAQRGQQSTLDVSSRTLHVPYDRDGSHGGSPAPSETETSSPDESPTTPYSMSPSASASPQARLNPVEVYPEAWHASLHPVMVRTCSLSTRPRARPHAKRVTGSLSQWHVYRSTRHKRSL